MTRLMECVRCETTYNRTISKGERCPDCGKPGRLFA